MKRFEIMEKFYSSKALLKIAGGGMHTPYPPLPPGSATVPVDPILTFYYRSNLWS